VARPPSGASVDAVVGVARDQQRADSPGRRGTPLGIDAVRPEEAQVAALLAEREKLQKELAAAQALAKGVQEAKQQTYPPQVIQAPEKPPLSESSKHDAAVGKVVRTLAVKLAAKMGWTPLLVALGVGGGAVAVGRPAGDPVKTEAQAVEVAALKRDHALVVEQLTGVLKREASRDAYIRCLDETLADMGSQLLPAQDRLGSAAKLRAYVDRCARLRP
jgi:hypothetical protein